MPDLELRATAPDHTLTITYEGRTWDLMAYPLEDFLGQWQVVAHERGTDGPALPASEWGVPKPLRSWWDALFTGAILHQIHRDAFWNATISDFEDCTCGCGGKRRCQSDEEGGDGAI
jgi:hypothetical protein